MVALVAKWVVWEEAQKQSDGAGDWRRRLGERVRSRERKREAQSGAG